MNELIVVGFDHIDDAQKALDRLRDLEHRGQVKFEDTALVEHHLDGTTRVKDEASGTTETATVVGAALGGIIAFAFPLAGMAVGAAAGAAVGRSLDSGISRSFVTDVRTTLKPGRSALFLLIKQGNPDAVRAAVRGLHGEIIQTTLTPEAEEALQNALSAH